VLNEGELGGRFLLCSSRRIRGGERRRAVFLLGQRLSVRAACLGGNRGKAGAGPSVWGQGGIGYGPVGLACKPEETLGGSLS